MMTPQFPNPHGAPDEQIITRLAADDFADFSSPLKGDAMAAALIPNGRPRLPVPRAVAIELIGDVSVDRVGDVAIADILATHDRRLILHSRTFVKQGGAWQIVTPTAH